MEEESKKYGFIATVVIVIGVILLICLPLKNIDVEYEEVSTNYITVNKDGLEVGAPKYVDYEEINTSNRYLDKENNSKYSQISVKNTSNETLYSISIRLREQETNEPSIISPSYDIETLKPDEAAILSAKHWDIKENEKLILDSYSYIDGNGTLYTVSETVEGEADKLGVHSEKNDKYYKYNNLNSDIRKILVEEIREVNENNKFYYEVDIKNISDEELEDVNVTLKEYLDGTVIGNLTEEYSYTLKPLDKATLHFEVKKDIVAEVEDYAYRTTDDSNFVKVFNYYRVFENEGKYDHYEYEDNDSVSEKNMYLAVINIAIVFISWQMDRYAKKLEEKCKLEDNEALIQRAKVVNRIKNIINITYIIIAVLIIYLSSK